MKRLSKLMSKRVVWGIIFLFAVGFGSVQAQKSIDINASEAESIQPQKSNDAAVVEMFKDIDRYRQYDYNKQLANLRSDNTGDTLLLNFFGDKQYKAVIQSVVVNDLGRTVITSQIVGSEFAYCYIIVSENGISISADVPQENEHFFAVTKNGQTYLGQMRKSVLDKDRLEGSEPVVDPIAPVKEENLEEGNLDDGVKKKEHINDPVLNDPPVNDPTTPASIDLFFTYTDSARIWAAASSTVTDINDVIDIAVAEANTVMVNSNTGISFNVVHRHLTYYAEGDNSNDFYRFRDKGDGYMDEVHDLRNVFCADIMVFLAKITYTGGTGGLLTSLNGFSDDTRASCICRVQQSATSSFTVVHELGHNMGCHHHRDQVTQPGPNTPLGNYTAGWKGTISGTKYCTVMTYNSASEYGESTPNYKRIPFFSSPDTTYNGTVIGDSATMDNARVLRDSKTVTADYRTPPTTSTLNVSPNVLSFTSEPSKAKKVAVAGFYTTGNINYVLGGNGASAFTVTPSATWIPTQGGILDVAFTGSTSQNYEAYITISAGGGAANKIINLKYTACSIPVSVVREDFNDAAFPPDCWVVEAATTAIWRGIQGTGTTPAAAPQSGSGMLEFYRASAPAGSNALLISPKINPNNQDYILSFWMYRDNYLKVYNHRVNVYLNTTPSLSGATLIRTVHGGRQNTPVVTQYNQWHQYMDTLPTGSMSEAYIIFEGVKGDSGSINMYIDNIILSASSLIVNPLSLTFDSVTIGTTSLPQSIAVSGMYLNGDITYSKTGTDASAFTITETSWNNSAGGTLNVTFSPTVLKVHNASIVFSSNGVANKTVNLNGKAVNTNGIKDITQTSSLAIFPNPTKGELRISLPNPSEGGAIEIYSVVGQCVMQLPCRDVINHVSTIDISHLASGLYFLKVGDRVVKFVKE